MTEMEYLPMAALIIAACAGGALMALVAFFWWVERGEKDADYDPYTDWDPDKWEGK